MNRKEVFYLVGPIGTSQITYSVLHTQYFTSTLVELHRIMKVVWITTNWWSTTSMQFPKIYYATQKLLMAKLLHFEPMLRVATQPPNTPTFILHASFYIEKIPCRDKHLNLEKESQLFHSFLNVTQDFMIKKLTKNLKLLKTIWVASLTT